MNWSFYKRKTNNGWNVKIMAFWDNDNGHYHKINSSKIFVVSMQYFLFKNLLIMRVCVCVPYSIK